MLDCSFDFLGFSNMNRAAVHNESPSIVSFSGMYLTSLLTLRLRANKYMRCHIEIDLIVTNFFRDCYRV